MSQIRIGFVGAGGIAHRHFGVLEQFDDVQILAVSDTEVSRAEGAAERFGARAFDSCGAMLAAVELDALYICVPPFAHGPPEEAAIKHELPLFVEKPISLDLGTAIAIAEQATAKQLVTAVGYHWRYLDTLHEVKMILAKSPAKLLSGYWIDSTPPPQWWWRKDRSGGQMVEQTTHIIDLMRYLVGEPVRVLGLAATHERAEFPGLDVPSVSTASLLFESGAIGNLASTCLLKWSHRVGLHLFGEGYAIELTDHDRMIDQGQGRRQDNVSIDPVVREDRDFIDAVKGQPNRIRCPYDEALRTHRVALAIVESARIGHSVELEGDSNVFLRSRADANG